MSRNRFSASSAWGPIFPSLYFQCAAIPRSAIRSISRVRIWISESLGSGNTWLSVSCNSIVATLVSLGQAGDFPAIVGVTLLLGVGYVAVNTLVDILQAVADPRIQT